jgi:spore coat protein A
MKKIRLIDRREFLKEGLLFGASLSVGLREFCKRGSLTSSAFLASPRHNHKLHYSWTKPLLDPYALQPFVDPLPIMPIARPTGHRQSLDGSGELSPVYSIRMKQVHLKLHRDLKPTLVWGYDGQVPGPTFETQSGRSILVNWISDLPLRHFLPIDHTIHGAEPNKPDVRNVVHLHGAKVQPDSDGFPEDWFTPGNQADYFYPNQMDATMLWYHDHALGITRLNVFAGLVGAFFIRDEFEASLNLPSGKFEIPLVIFDRSFEPNGQFNYPVSGNPTVPHVPEYFGNVIAVNGKVMPFLDVQPRKYRFRIVNASNGRFLNMSLSSGQPFIQIGSDQGLLQTPVTLQTILMTPAERFDIVLDFSQFKGQKIELTNNAPAPWPGGGQITPTLVMQFRVAKYLAHKDTSTVPPVLRPIVPLNPAMAVTTRDLSLVEYDDDLDYPLIDLLDNKRWADPVSETPVLDTIEIWNLVNTTDDGHPIHIHLIRFQITGRTPFDVDQYVATGELIFTGPTMPPDPNEVGWKDTVRVVPGLVTQVIAMFEGFSGQYVWHCHILEHEDQEMMRPFVVLPSPSSTARDATRPAGGAPPAVISRR